jgi:hypothetical protein
METEIDKGIFRYKVYEEIIRKYQLVCNYRERNLGDEYIKMKYKLKPKIIEAQYNAIPEEKRNEILKNQKESDSNISR